MKILTALDGLDCYANLLHEFAGITKRHNHNFEIQDVILRLNGSALTCERMRRFLDHQLSAEPSLLIKGLHKAERAYSRSKDRITKPSYIGRILSFSDYSKRKKQVCEIDQLDSVARGFCEEPNASYHVVSIFRPLDLIEKFRPGYVPCVICADFKYRNKKLNGKFFFRSCDAFNLFPFDFFYCSSILQALVERIQLKGFKGKIETGDMTFWFSRIYLSRFDRDKLHTMLELISKYQNSFSVKQSRRRSQVRSLYFTNTTASI
jgi:thymidylate synthase